MKTAIEQVAYAMRTTSATPRRQADPATVERVWSLPWSELEAHCRAYGLPLPKQLPALVALVNAVALQLADDEARAGVRQRRDCVEVER